MMKFISCALIAVLFVVTGCANIHDNKKDCCGDMGKSGDKNACSTMPAK